MGSQDNRPAGGEEVPVGTPLNVEKQDLNAAIGDAFNDLDIDDTDSESLEEETETDDDADTPDASKGAPPDDDTDDSDDASPEGDKATADAPERYFEVDLSGLPVEERAKIIEALKGRDDEIGKLLRGKAEGEEEPPAPVDPPEPISDEDILTTLGIDPEFDETAAKVAIPLVRGMQELQARVDQLLEQSELRDLDAYWTSSLDALEKENGELPVDRVAVLEYAAQNGLQTPEQAYWTIAGPARRQVEAAVAAAQARVTAKPGAKKPSKKDVSSARPKAAAASEEIPADGEGKSLRDVVKEQGDKVLRDLGLGR